MGQLSVKGSCPFLFGDEMKHLGPLDYADPRGECPLCGRQASESGYEWSTLVGYPPGQDDNHKHRDFKCGTCNFTWRHHWREASRRSWITNIEFNGQHYLIKGENGCYETWKDTRKGDI